MMESKMLWASEILYDMDSWVSEMFQDVPCLFGDIPKASRDDVSTSCHEAKAPHSHTMCQSERERAGHLEDL
jgi:hypothetical protein